MVSSAPQPPTGRPIRALLWDVDGTLAETELEGHRRAFNRAFTEEGLAWCWDVDTYLQLLRISGGRERMRVFGRTTDPTFDIVSFGLNFRLSEIAAAIGPVAMPGASGRSSTATATPW